MEQAKVIRRQRKAAITRHLGTLDRLLAEEETEQVKERLEKISVAFLRFETSHDEYNELLKDDDDEIEASDCWFHDVQNVYVNGVKSARAWLRSQACIPSTPAVPTSFSTPPDLIRLLSIPKVEIDKFDGDPLEYQTFIAIFNEMVDSKAEDYQVKLTRLLQYTSGEAKAAIKNCALIGSEEGYTQALGILKNRYGNTHLVSQRIINDLKKGKSVSKAHDLQQLADELAMALTALKKLDMLSELNTQQSIIDILQRCQPYVRYRWRKKALEKKNNSQMYPDISDFVDFIKLVASEACDPVYGAEATKSCSNAKSFHTVTNSSPISSHDLSLGSEFPNKSTPVSSNNSDYAARVCVVCGMNHGLFYCDQFKGMRPEARLDIAIKNKLCFNCLLSGHNSLDCRKNSVCSVPGCGRKHTKFIHVDNDSQTANVINCTSSGNAAVQDVTNGNVNNCAEVGNNVNAVFSHVYLPIVPVVINGDYEVYALLDTGSTSTFITHELVSRLKLGGSDFSCRMSTLGNVSDVRTKVVSFDLTSVDRSETLSMQNVLVVPHIPARYPNHAINLKSVPHLADLPIHQIDKNVQISILIGMDHAYALMPREVRCNPCDKRQPYASRTLFGWSLNGLIGDQSVIEVASNFVSMDQQIENLWNMETWDDDRVSTSFEDRKVIDLWNQNVWHNEGHYVLPIPWKEEKPNFPDNKYTAMSRLKNLRSRLLKKDMLELYNENLHKIVSDGYAERVPEQDLHL